MSITDELREHVQGWRETPNLMDDLDAGDIDGLLGDFEHIADCIDSEHERAMSRAGQLLADAEKDRDYNYANWQDCKQKVLQGNITFNELEAEIERLKDELLHCIELPKDADGEPWHINDEFEINKGIAHVNGIGDNRLFYIDNDGMQWTRADNKLHYHEPTVEDVLQELVVDWDCAPDGEDKAAVLKEYAKRLKLAEDEDA